MNTRRLLSTTATLGALLLGAPVTLAEANSVTNPHTPTSHPTRASRTHVRRHRTNHRLSADHRYISTSPAAGRVLFSGSAIGAWGLNQSATPTRVRSLGDSLGVPTNVLSFTTHNNDIAPLTPTDNPRSQLTTPHNIIKRNKPFWESYEVYIPKDFPVAGTWNGWIALGSPVYGAPFNCTSPVVLSIENGDFRWQANAYWAKPWAVLWQTPLRLGQWIRFMWHIDPSVHGFAELYMNNVPVETDDLGKTTHGLHMAILDGANDIGPWFSQLSVYYKHNQFPSLNVDFANFRMGTTRTAVESGGAGRLF